MTLRERLTQFVVLGLAVTLGLSIYADIGRLRVALRAFDWWLLLPVIGLTLGNQALRFLKWEYLLREADIRLDVLSSVQIFGSGLIMILTPGKAGEVWKSWLVRDVNGTPIQGSMPVIAVERLTDLVGILLISSVGVLAFGYSPVLFAVAAGLVVFGIALVQVEPVCRFGLDVLERLPVLGRKADAARELYDRSRSLLRPRPLFVTSTLSVCSWGLECLGMWLVLTGFGADVSVLAAAFVFAFASIVGAASLLPGGVGATEGTMTGLLLVFGVERSVAVSATLVVRAATLWLVAALAFAVYANFKTRAVGVEDVFGNE